MQNPLLEPFDQAPFSKIKNEHYLPAFEKAMADAKEEINTISNLNEAPSFENTVIALEQSGEQLDRISSIFFNLNAAETNPELQQIAQEIAPKLSAFKNDIILNKQLFDRIKRIVDQQPELDEESQMLLEKNYKSFTRNGALLQEEQQQQLRLIDEELSKSSLLFGQHLLADSNAYELLLNDPSDLEGLPEGYIEMSRSAAKEKNLEGWLITLSYPSYIPFMKFSKKRALREQLYRAFSARGYQNNENNNEQIIKTIVELRYQRAQLLGYDSHADYVLEERMAASPEKVFSFLNELRQKAYPAAKNEFEMLCDYAKKDGIDQIQKWDAAYYSELLKKEKFELDDEVLKPYFELDAVIKGVFEVARKLYGLRFKKTTEVSVYHPDVKTYHVVDENNNDVALFYADFHPRAGKRDGAWMTSYKSQYRIGEQSIRPHVSIVCNFTKPTATKPSLLTFNEVTTLFHEFGHALHGMLANTRFKSLSGTSVSWDFVELPSQLLENWCYEKDALELFAKHYQTKELIPQSMIKKIVEASNFLEGLATMRQLSFAVLDMKWHSSNPNELGNSIKAVESEVFEQTDFYPQVENSCMSTAFSHIFQGGYAAGYYSYKWAEVLDADAFEYFKEHGIFNSVIATAFKEHILSKGGTKKPMDLYTAFRGKQPSIEPLLKRSGLMT